MCLQARDDFRNCWWLLRFVCPWHHRIVVGTFRGTLLQSDFRELLQLLLDSRSRWWLKGIPFQLHFRPLSRCPWQPQHGQEWCLFVSAPPRYKDSWHRKEKNMLAFQTLVSPFVMYLKIRKNIVGVTFSRGVRLFLTDHELCNESKLLIPCSSFSQVWESLSYM
jgi:hypothetical protein